MELKYSISPNELKKLSTKELRDAVMIEQVFAEDQIKLTYSFDERFVLGGVMPVNKTLKLEPADEIRTEYFLKTREMGIINIGGAGVITVDGTRYEIAHEEGMYLGCETRDVTFESADKKEPAKFYVTSVLAHRKYPTVKITKDLLAVVRVGSKEGCSDRIVSKYIHKDGVKSCQLQMGTNSVQPGNVWNTLPTHSHKRRVECFMYYNMSPDDFYVSFIGEKDETRHVILRNEQAIVSAAWQVHFGVGTKNYDFIWAMGGENQDFPDMDTVAMKELL